MRLLSHADRQLRRSPTRLRTWQKMTRHGSLDVGLACAKMMKTPLGALLNMLTLQTLVLLLLPEVVMPRPVDLPGAASDVVELERLATRLGPTRLLKLATRPTTDKDARRCWR